MSANDLVTNRIIEALERGTAPWRKPWRTGQTWAANLVTRKPYRGINQFLLHLTSDYTSPYWVTYKQAADLGGHVRKGEKGTPIVFVGQGTAKDESAKDTDAAKSFTFLKSYTVFNAEQCEGLELPADETVTRTPHERIEAAEAIVAGYSDKPAITTAAQAWYRPSTDTVGIPALDLFDAPQHYYATLFHELAHSTGHQSRCKRDGILAQAGFGSEIYSKEELIAEMTAAFLCAEVGIDTVEPSASYLKSWITVLKGDNRLVVSAAAKAQQAFDYIKGGAQ
jgi:antirestriction protein ArdC